MECAGRVPALRDGDGALDSPLDCADSSALFIALAMCSNDSDGNIQSPPFQKPVSEDSGDVGQLDFQDLFVEEQERVESLVLDGSGYVFVYGEMTQESAHGSASRARGCCFLWKRR